MYVQCSGVEWVWSGGGVEWGGGEWDGVEWSGVEWSGVEYGGDGIVFPYAIVQCHNHPLRITQTPANTRNHPPTPASSSPLFEAVVLGISLRIHAV